MWKNNDSHHNFNKLLIIVHDNLTFENCGRFTLRHSHSVLSQFARKVQCEQVGLAASNFRKPEVSHLPPSQPPRQAGLESRPASLACSAPIYTESSETEKGSYDNDPRSVGLSVEPRAVRPNAQAFSATSLRVSIRDFISSARAALRGHGMADRPSD